MGRLSRNPFVVLAVFCAAFLLLLQFRSIGDALMDRPAELARLLLDARNAGLASALTRIA